jgi:hypothetical protein
MPKVFHFPKKSTLPERIALCSERDPVTGCLLWTAGTRGGYGRIFWRGKYLRAHREVWAAKNGQIPAGMNVCHTCDTPRCIEVEHLFLGTQPDNIADMIAKGRDRKVYGEAHHKAKLTENDVITIRADNRTQAAIAENYGVARSLVWAIKKRKCWKHI